VIEEISKALEVVMAAAGFESDADHAVRVDRGAVIVPAATPAPHPHRHAALKQPAPVSRKSARRRKAKG